MKRRLVLIKFGGSLITDKQRQDVIHSDIIQFCAAEVRELYNSLSNTDLIIGTGGGSFAHINAHEYLLEQGARTVAQLYGMCITHNNVRRLNGMFVDQLTRIGVSAFAVSPAGIFTMNNQEIASVHAQPLKQLLAADCIPVLHGDMVLDVRRGATIVSTEEVLQVCLEKLRSSYEEIVVVYCMDTNGLLGKGFTTVPRFERDEEVIAHHSAVHDVTGGIVNKIKSARLAADVADRVYLISGKEKDSLFKAVVGKHTGTRIL